MRVLPLILWGIYLLLPITDLTAQCDSLAIQHEINFLVCPDESVTYNGVEIPNGSTASFHFLTPEGCDSIVTVNVEAIELDTSVVELAACAGDSAVYHGHSILAGESKLITVAFSDGCDSSILISVSILPSDTTYSTLEICNGDSVEYHGMVFSEGDHGLLKLTNQQGCDSIVFVTVTTTPSVSFQTTTKATCPDAAEGVIEIEVSDGTPPFKYAINNEDFQDANFFEYLKSGEYSIKVADHKECRQQQEVVVPERERLKLWIDDQRVPCSDPSLTIRPLVLQHAGELSWEWADGSDNEWLHVRSPGEYFLEISDDCTVLEQAIQVSWGNDLPEELIYFPNAFSPNGDGHNDQFRVYSNQVVAFLDFELQIFDRWGASMFIAHHPQTGWDGKHQLEEKNPDVYAYFMKAAIEVCGQKEDIFKKGDLTLMR